MANDDTLLTDPQRRRLVIATSAAGGIAAAGTAVPFVASMMPSERAKAVGAPMTVDISKLRPGEMMAAPWRGQPVWILHRTPGMLAGLNKIEDDLLDPASERLQQPEYCRNVYRSRKPEYLVAVGICTHLGCVPTFRPDIAPSDLGPKWEGGYFCPCHGSTFDLAGRVYKGKPAPLNLVIPPYYFSGAGIVTVGLDEEKA